MEKFSFQSEGELAIQPAGAAGRPSEAGTGRDWRHALPVLTGSGVTLRELRIEDAPSLLELLTTDDVTRFISPPPTTTEGFERFIALTQRLRATGSYICFAVVPPGSDRAAGILQVRQIAPGFKTAEWGFVLGSAFWGTGMFCEAARIVLDFLFGEVGVHRLEARAAVENRRGNSALRKVGATQEGVLRRSFLRHGRHLDQILWSILQSDWKELKASTSATIH